MIISHIRKIDDKNFIIQSNAEHLIGVSKLAGSFADEFNMGDWARVAGILHDKGKEKKRLSNLYKIGKRVWVSGRPVVGAPPRARGSKLFTNYKSTY